MVHRDGEAGQDSLVCDVSGEHGFAQPVGSDECEVAALTDEVEAEGPFDQVALDLFGPVPVEVGDGLEASDAGSLKAAVEAASCLFDLLEASDFFEDLCGRPAALGSACEEIVESLGNGDETDFVQPGGQVSCVRRHRRRCGEQVHRRSPRSEV